MSSAAASTPPSGEEDDLLGRGDVSVSRSARRPRAELLPFGVRDPIPAFHLPLDPGEPEPVLHVGDTLHRLYERARYHRVIDYACPPVPSLSATDRAWANRRLREARVR